MFVQAEHIEFGALARPCRNNGPPLLMHIEHKQVGFVFRVSKKLLENEGNVRHEVAGVVPHQDNPRRVVVGYRLNLLVEIGLCHLLVRMGSDEPHRKHSATDWSLLLTPFRLENRAP